MERPLIPLLFASMAGIAIGNSYRLENLPLLTSLLVALILVALMKKSHKLTTVILLFSFVFLGILNINLYLDQDPGSNHIFHYISKDKVSVEGMICETPQSSPDRTELTVSTKKIVQDDTTVPVEGLVLLTVGNNQKFKYGDYIRFKTRLKAPHSFRNPGGFDYEKHIKYKGIMVRGFIKDSAGIVILRENQANIVKTQLERLRKNIKKLIQENAPSPEREIIQAMIL